MTHASRSPRRSVLFMPGDNERALEKARGLKADALVFDLEDAVAPTHKDSARAGLLDNLIKGGYGGRELVVRINGLGTPWAQKDVAMLKGHAEKLVDARTPVPLALLLPKVESAGDITKIEAMMDDAGYGPEVALWVMIETPMGVLNAAQIAAAGKRLDALIIGVNDLSKEMGATLTRSRQALVTSLQKVVLAAKAYGKSAIDGVYNDFGDKAGFMIQCEQGKGFGFDGKSLIHPTQIDASNEVFSPDADAIEHARAVIEAFEMAEAEGKGVAVLGGQMIEALHVVDARNILALADKISGG
jgi:citrate lyase subunit beta / citryl-CoA lyase